MKKSLVYKLFLVYCTTVLWGHAEGCWPQEREALLDLQAATRDVPPDGSIRNDLSADTNKSDVWFEWDDEAPDCCHDWQGVTCDPHSGRVTKLQLPTCKGHSKRNFAELLPLHCYYMCSSLPASLSRLEALEVLDLRGGCLSGDTPPHIFTPLKNLTHLDLSNNFLSHPTNLPLLPKLTYLNYSGLTLLLQGPPGLNLSNLAHSLPNLMYLDLSNFLAQMFNPLTEPANSIIMKFLPIQGSIPSDFSASFLPNLAYLDLSGNGLSGVIPKELGTLQNLAYLDLSFNALHGVIPEQLGTLQSLAYLNLAGNTFQNPLPWPSLANLSQLTHLELGNLAYEDADVLVWEERQAQWQCKWKALESLSCSNMRFASNDSIPFCLEQPGVLSKLKTLSFSAHNGSIGPLLHSLSLVNASLNLQALLLPGTSLGEFQAQHPAPAVGLHPLDTPFLQSLDVSHNALTSFPTWLPQLQLLERLDISNNSLSEFPLSLRQLQFLKTLDISSNGMNVSLHQLDLQNSTKLESLQLSNNEFTGSIPLSLLQPSLSVLDLSDNSLSGGIPFSIGNMSKLSSLDLSHNLLSGSIPLSLLQPSLSVLDLSDNLLSGGIPFSIGNMSKLSSLDLSHNLLSGGIPFSIGNMSKLSSLNLSHNLLSGGIPFSIGNMSKLSSLYLSNNKLSGVFPPSMSNLTALTELELSNNNLTGVIPLYIFGFKLSKLDLSNNRLAGNLPRMMRRNCAALRTLDLSNNNLSGSLLPYLFQNCPTLSSINLSNNSLSGTLPQTYHNCMTLSMLDLSSNHLTGALPEGMFINCSHLNLVNLGQNSLSLEIPASVANLKFIEVFILYNNEFTGEIPMALQNCSFLMVLDLSHNKLSGSIPRWITDTNFPYLAVLMLSNNQFQGSIPSSLVGNLTSLQILGLANNNLSGSIPIHLDHLVGMTIIGKQPTTGTMFSLYSATITIPMKGVDRPISKVILSLTMALDLSYNLLEGPIPLEIGALKGLRIVNLSHNALSGPIPSTIGGLSGALESLDLSDNQLTGGIPWEFCSLDYLQALNVSSNHLRGDMPTCPHLISTFTASSFAHNDGLCGSILGNQCPTVPAAQEALQKEAHLTWYAKLQEFVALEGVGIGYALGLVLMSLFLYFRA